MVENVDCSEHRKGAVGVLSQTAIAHLAKQVARVVDEIGAALDKQALAAQEIARGVERIASMSEQNSASVRETSGAAAHLQNLTSELESSVARFRI